MALHNPYREYDKGMDDAYCGREPQNTNGRYMQGYNRLLQLEDEEQRRKEHENKQTINHPRGGGRR